MCFPLDSCCCCVSLEVGTQVISLISTMLAAGLSLLYGSTAALLQRRDIDSKITFYLVVATASGVQSFFGCLLIWAAFTGRPRVMWPWLIVSWIAALALLGASILGAAALIYNGIFEITAAINAMISIYFIYAVTLLYFASVVNSRRKELMLQQDRIILRPTSTASWKYV